MTTQADANGVHHNSNPLWSRLACPLGGAIIGVCLVHAVITSPLWLLGALLGAALFAAGMYPSTYTAYWRTVERHHRAIRKARP